MKRYLAAIAVLMLSTPSYAANVGDLLPVRIGCMTKELIQAQVDAVLADKSYARANEIFNAAHAAGDCAIFPDLFPVQVVSVGPMHKFTSHSGNDMLLQVVEVQTPNGTTFWSVDFRKDDKGV